MDFFPSSLDGKTQLITVAVLLLLALAGWRLALLAGEIEGPRRAWPLLALAALAAMVLYLFAAAPRGVAVDERGLVLVRRVGSRSWPLTGEVAARRLEGLSGAWRRFGVGGFFGSFGHFSSRPLGRFYLHATRLDRLVLVDGGPRRLAVSVDDPDGLLTALQARRSR